MNPIKRSFEYGGKKVTLETGEIARQATGAVLVDVEGTSVLVSVVGKKEVSEGQDFFPLTVNYQEKTYAAGKIPGGFFKREGRPTEKETLTSRLIDRPIRPLFPEGFKNEVQVIATVVSINPEIDSDIVAMLGTSAALAISGIPFNGPIGAARVGYINGDYVLNPTPEALKTSELDLVVAGTQNAVLMVESEAKELPESVMLGAVVFGHSEMQVAIQAINEFSEVVATQTWEWKPAEENHDLINKVTELAQADITAAYQVADKMARYERLNGIRESVATRLMSDESPELTEDAIKKVFSNIEKNVVRSRIVRGEARIDGRESDMIRALYIKTGVLPRTHGSALFTRGETQALVVATLGTERDAQIIDGLMGEEKDNFMLHYNFPPYCVGEVGFMSGPKRREIGHGRLAKRAIVAVKPDAEDFPYTLRVVSEITESNGSSSMASVCGTSLALMDAGVPMKAPVAGIAMGLVKEGEQFVVLSDILGDEDHLGDMDFKVAGSEKGITALQMDIKIDGITKEIMEVALHQAKAGRLHILGVMNEAISSHRNQISEFAPRITTMKINPEKIAEVIGKGGSVIRSITEETGATVEIDDDGTVRIAAVDKTAGDAAEARITDIVTDVEEGTIYEGTVNRLADFGAFVNIKPGKDGLVHISQIAHERVNKVSDRLALGDKVKVKVLEIDRQGRIRLSMKALLEAPPSSTEGNKNTEAVVDNQEASPAVE